MNMWEDGDCPWCRSLLDPGPVPALTEPGRAECGNDRAEPWGTGPPAWLDRAHPFLLPMAALTVVAALMLAVTLV